MWIHEASENQEAILTLQGPMDARKRGTGLADLTSQGLTGPADLGMSRAASHLPLKHQGSMLSFLRERTILLQVSMAKTGIPPPKFLISKECSQTKPIITVKSDWPWPPEGQLSLAFQTLWLCAFLFKEKNLLGSFNGKVPSCPGTHG